MASALLTFGLKSAVHERRPSGRGFDSFPSAHTSLAFAAATSQSAFHPTQAPLWFAGATLIGLSRIYLHDHYAWDVLAGAGVGYAAARLELSGNHRFSMAPFLQGNNRALGIEIRTAF